MARVYPGLLALAALGVAMTAGRARADDDLAKLLPREVAGYRAEPDDQLFDRDSLFDLIDGSAEVYRALNVRAVISRRYVGEGSADVMVDLFDMGSASDAFGAYHHDMRDGEPGGVGQESELEAGSLFFWKDRYFVSIVALEDERRTRKAVRAIGKAIARAIPREGQPPALVGLLPRKGRVASQLHYFHGWQLLARHYRFGDGNPLGLGVDTEGVIARYRRAAGGSKTRQALVLIRYPSAAAAALALERFDADTAGAAWRAGSAARVQGDVLAIALDAPSVAAARALLDEVRTRRGGKR